MNKKLLLLFAMCSLWILDGMAGSTLGQRKRAEAAKLAAQRSSSAPVRGRQEGPPMIDVAPVSNIDTRRSMAQRAFDKVFSQTSGANESIRAAALAANQAFLELKEAMQSLDVDLQNGIAQQLGFIDYVNLQTLQ